MVYLIKIEGQDICKVGHSADPIKRMQTLQTNAPHKLRLIGTLPGSCEEEAEIHALFDGQRMSGEWFYLSNELANVFCPVVDGEFEHVSQFTCGSPFCKDPAHALDAPRKVAVKSEVIRRGYLWLEAQNAATGRKIERYSVANMEPDKLKRLKEITEFNLAPKKIQWATWKSLDFHSYTSRPNEPHGLVIDAETINSPEPQYTMNTRAGITLFRGTMAECRDYKVKMPFFYSIVFKPAKTI